MIRNYKNEWIRIMAHCGTHKVQGFTTELTLLKVDYLDDNANVKREGYEFLEFIRADFGWTEIEIRLKKIRSVNVSNIQDAIASARKSVGK